MTLELDGHNLTVVRRGLGASTTLVNPSASDPSTVRLQFLPVGGRLFLSILGHELSIYLSERRCALLAVLLQPPGESDPGDYIPDEEVFPRVWGKGQGDRNTLDVLLSRVRKEFEAVGLDGFRYLERMPGGGATRFRVGPATRISVS